jgi:hypothetical protein
VQHGVVLGRVAAAACVSVQMLVQLRSWRFPRSCCRMEAVGLKSSSRGAATGSRYGSAVDVFTRTGAAVVRVLVSRNTVCMPSAAAALLGGLVARRWRAFAYPACARRPAGVVLLEVTSG